MQDSLSFALTQISYLVFNINKRNFSQNVRLINKLVQQFGLEADRHYLRCLFSSIDFGDVQAAKSSPQAKLLSNELTALLDKPSLISNICFAFDNPIISQKITNFKPNLHQISKTLNFSSIQEVALTLALQHSSNTELAKSAENHLKICLPNLLTSYINLDTTTSSQDLNLNDISPELLQLILSVLSHEKYRQFNITDIVYNKFIDQLCKDFPKDRVPLILAPLLYTENFGIDPESFASNDTDLNSEIMDTSWSNLIVEIGYVFTASVEECKSHLSKVGGRDLTALDIARLISLMCRTHTNLSDSSINLPTPSAFWNQAEREKALAASGEHITWKPEVFVQALKEVAPNLDWKNVCIDLDHPDFLIKDRTALNLLLTICHLGLQLQTNGQAGSTFPVECLYRHWNNAEGQLSLIAIILKNPDVYSFSDHIFTSVSIELLKTPPEMDSKEIAAWKSLHLVEVLLYIGDTGLFAPVLEIFKVPLQHCPDVLFMALLQINPPITPIRQELFNKLLPIFLTNHPNSGPILHHAWNAPNFNHTLKHFIMQAMSDWYVHGDYDQSRLTRILDVAQDLKALSSLLNVRSFMFVIDLACLASRREYLKLEKWLSDKIREHGEPFVQVIAKFLQRRCPQIMGMKLPEDQIPKSAQLPQETLVIMLNCLQAYAGNVSQELADIIMTMTTNCNLLLSKNRQVPPPGVIRQRENPFSASGGINPHVFGASAVDSIAAGLNSSMAGLNLAGPAANAFNNYGSVLGNLVSTPASPSRLLGGPSNSPFPLMSMQGVGGNSSNISRLAPTPINDKLSMPSTTAVLTEMATQVSKEVEDEANSYFQRIYNVPPHPTLSIDEVLDMLQRFQESQNRREREVYQCMLRNLFEEYKFFPQYPEKELQITAQLFGGMIERHLVTTYVALGLALRCVLDALKKPEGSKMYYFGITALDKFKTKLHLYQKYCEHVRSLPNFNDFPPDLIQYVEYGCQGQEPPNKPPAPLGLPMTGMVQPQGSGAAAGLYRSNSVTGNIVTTPTSSAAKPATTPISQPIAPTRFKSIANATNIDTLLIAADNKESFTQPPDSVQDKTAFIFNNLSQLNLTQKCEEIKEILTKEYYPWMSHYLVLKRASIELNFHGLYSNFLDSLKIPDINKLVTKETFRNIKVLLRSDKGIANFSDRSLLKNLGHWLGMLTLARNKPILQIDIDMKSLLVEAYHKGQQELLYVVPFVAKVLESCAKSKVFKPPNPWTMAIMNVLAELHQEPDLKLNLKFEIEVLCKNLSIDVADLKPAIYLKDPERILTIEYQLSQPSKQKDTTQAAAVLATLPTSEETTTATGSISSQSPSTLDGSGVIMTPPEPRFTVMDINVTNLSAIANQIVYNPTNMLLVSHPQLKQVVRNAIERTITEWITPVVDRSVKIALKTSEQIVRKDFSLEPDENRFRSSAHNMVRNLAAGMAMITCRDQLLQNMQNTIKTLFMNTLSPAQKDVIEQTATQLATDNTELACVFIQKSAMEKAVQEIDKLLAADYDARKQARQEGRRYYDATVFNYQAERLPETIRLKVGGINPQQLAVYDEFARNIPGFQPILEREPSNTFMPKLPNFFQDPITPMPPMAPVTPFSSQHSSQIQSNNLPFDEMSVIYDEIISKMESFINGVINTQQLQLHVQNVQALFECLMNNNRRIRDNMAGIALLKRTVENLMEGLINISDCAEQIKLYRDIHLRILRLLQDNRNFGLAYTNKSIAKYIMDCREEVRYNIDAIDLLISSNFVHLPTYDQLLTQLIDNGSNYMAITLSMQLVQMYFVDERQEQVVTESDFMNTIEILVRLSAHPRAPEGLPHLIDMLRSNQDPTSVLVDRAVSGPTSYIHSGMVQARATDLLDSDGFAEKTEHLFRHWVYQFHNEMNGRDPLKIFSGFVSRMNYLGVLKGDEQLTKFFSIATKMCIDASYRNLNDPSNSQTMAKAKTFNWIDAYIRLISLLVKHSGEGGSSSTKLNLLNKVLGIVVGTLLQDQECHGTNFQQFGYHRIFIMLFHELTAHDPILENISVGVVTAFCHTYHILRPSNAPGFCYSWLELISNRLFIGRILAAIPQQKGWFMYSQLLVDLFKYLAPFLRNAELAKPVTVLYKGTLRVLLVLLHDFPEFLCDYHFGFCDVIPPNCIQMRNLILSAYPRNMRLPDPFTPNLKVSMLNDITTAPRICTNYSAAIQPSSFKKDLDSYLKQRAPVTFFAELKRNIQVSNEPGSRYNIPLMNALVLYVGTQAISHIRLKNQVPSKQTVASSAHMDIFQNLAVDSDNEGRYLFLNAIANQLRYPNSHTHYFSCTLLYLFHETNSEAIQEQITRVLLERLIVNRPHPWGLLITFIELIKNPEYEFWNHDFVHCAPEIEKLFESVARSCMVKTSNQQQIQNSDAPELSELN